MLIIFLALTLVAADESGHDHAQAGDQAGRSAPQGDLALRDAVDKLDKQFLYLLSTIAGKLGVEVSNTKNDHMKHGV